MEQLLLRAIESNSHLRHSFFFLSLLVIKPSNRPVVFRGFEENSDRIQINTDFRTRKIEELNHCPFAEICWYFSDSWEHSGSMEELKLSMGPIPIRKSFRFCSLHYIILLRDWFASYIKSRLQYLVPNPGIPCLSEQSPDEFLLDFSSGLVTTFCLLVLEPDQVDYLNLKSNHRIVPPCHRVPMEKCVGI
ncbi:pyridoxine 5'-phosphate oxidase-related family protein [Salix suchowensis]|nr:pyridoxine 5'-phosphate oxidase-related family protein [Salix suchowensis]